MATQFSHPSGLLGRLVSRMLAKGNAGFNVWLVDQLQTAVPNPGLVIELGCGPGVALQKLLAAYPRSRIVGIDPSPVVLKSARRRTSAAIAAGRLELVTGDSSKAPGFGPADLIVATHVLYFLTDPVRQLNKVGEALSPSGRLALGYQLRQNMPPMAQRNFPEQGFILYDSDEQLADVLTEAGFNRPEIRLFGDQDRPGGRLALTTLSSQ